MTVSLLIIKTMYAGHSKETNSCNKRHLNLSRTAVYQRFYNLKYLMMKRRKAWCNIVRPMSPTHNCFRRTLTPYTTFKMVEGATKSQVRLSQHRRRKRRRRLAAQSQLLLILNHRLKLLIRPLIRARIRLIEAIAVGRTKWWVRWWNRLIKSNDVCAQL